MGKWPVIFRPNTCRPWVHAGKFTSSTVFHLAWDCFSHEISLIIIDYQRSCAVLGDLLYSPLSHWSSQLELPSDWRSLAGLTVSGYLKQAISPVLLRRQPINLSPKNGSSDRTVMVMMPARHNAVTVGLKAGAKPATLLSSDCPSWLVAWKIKISNFYEGVVEMGSLVERYLIRSGFE